VAFLRSPKREEEENDLEGLSILTSLVFDKVGRRHAEGCSELSDGAAVGFYLVTLDSDYGIDADPGFVRELFLG
jgi:hypothetical protein